MRRGEVAVLAEYNWREHEFSTRVSLSSFCFFFFFAFSFSFNFIFSALALLGPTGMTWRDAGWVVPGLDAMRSVHLEAPNVVILARLRPP